MLNDISKAGSLPFILFWIVLNLVQSAFTELFHDEALYWVCSQNIDWGFWDHPPAAPFLIFLGSAILPGELGVRLLVVAASALTIHGIWYLTRPADNRLFFALIFSVFLAHIGGFMAAPDIPLLLVAVWFLVLLREYLLRDRWTTAIALSVLVAGLAYSKYHGAIFLLFAFLPNWKLIRRPSFWLIPFLALALFAPHLYWQWKNNFPTFRYHLIDRAGDVYKWTFITDYIGGQLLVFGPLIGILLLAAAFRYRSADPFDRTMKWVLWGVLGFFLYQSFSQRTEANWTATAIVPLVYLGYKFVYDKPVWRKWAFGLAIPSLLLILVFRLYLMIDFMPVGTNPRNEFHRWDRWAEDIAEVAENRPVVFFNTYRGPSKYMFYTGKSAHSLSRNSHAGNQYALFGEQEADLQGREVLLIAPDLPGGTPFRPGGMNEQQYLIYPDFRSYNRVRIELEDGPKSLPSDTLVYLTAVISNPTAREIKFSDDSRGVSLYYQVFKRDDIALEGLALERLEKPALSPGEVVRWKLALKTTGEPGEYRFRFGFRVEGMSVGRNGNFNKLTIY
jgi:hypothetical protein